MLAMNMLVATYLGFTSLCSLFVLTNSRTSTMWKLNVETGKIEKLDLMGGKINGYPLLDENVLYNFHSMAEVYSRDESFFTLVSSTRINDFNGWLRQSVDYSLESLLEAKKIRFQNVKRISNNKSYSFQTNINAENRISITNSSQNFDTLDCGQPVNYTNYDYIVNLKTLFNRQQTRIMPEPEVIHYFLHSHDQGDFKNFNVEALENRLKYFKEQNPSSAELFHHIGNYWRIVGDPVQAIKCFRRSLDLSPTASDVLYDLAKVLHNLQYLDDAINVARRSIEFQTRHFSAWRQYLLLGDIMKSYGDLRGSIHYYRLALDLNPTQEIILKLNEVDQKPTANLHTYTIVIIVILVIIVLTAVLTLMTTEVRISHHKPNGYCGINSEMCDVKPQHNFNRAVRSRSMRQRKY